MPHHAFYGKIAGVAFKVPTKRRAEPHKTDFCMQINGSCHCRNISFALTWEPDPVKIPARGCACSFCAKHGGVWTSNPKGLLKVAVGDASLVSKYRFGTRTAEFHVCARCGIVPVVTSVIEDHLYAVVNVNTFDGMEPSLLDRSLESLDGETEPSRLARRKRNWIANVEYIEGVNAWSCQPK